MEIREQSIYVIDETSQELQKIQGETKSVLCILGYDEPDADLNDVRGQSPVFCKGEIIDESEMQVIVNLIAEGCAVVIKKINILS